ncbi:MAG: hypothetical protein AAFP16_08440 [Pseudomonadota bacterium]
MTSFLRYAIALLFFTASASVVHADTQRIKAETKVMLTECLSYIASQSFDPTPFVARGYEIKRSGRVRLEVIPFSILSNDRFSFEMHVSSRRDIGCDAWLFRAPMLRSQAQAQEDAVQSTVLETLAAQGFKKVRYLDRRKKQRIGWQRGARILGVYGTTRYTYETGYGTARTSFDVWIVQ